MAQCVVCVSFTDVCDFDINVSGKADRVKELDSIRRGEPCSGEVGLISGT